MIITTLKQQRILAIEAHPDDLAFFYGGYIAKMIAEGHVVRVLTVTNGDQSTCDPNLSQDEIVSIYERNMQKQWPSWSEGSALP